MFTIFLNEEFDVLMVPRTCSGSLIMTHILMVTIKFCQLSLKFPLALSEACLTVGLTVQRRWTIWTKGEAAKKAGAPDCRCCCSPASDQQQLTYLFLVPSSHDKKHILRQSPYITEESSRNAIPTTGSCHSHTEKWHKTSGWLWSLTVILNGLTTSRQRRGQSEGHILP